jgi:GxxExxY protein
MGLEHQPLSEAIIGAAITVHRELGPGFLEQVYENALSLELSARGIPIQRQLPVSVVYRGVEVGLHRLDLVVDKRLVVELKAVRALDNVHFAIVRSYLNAISLDHGLILNFAKTTLEIKRVAQSTRDSVMTPPAPWGS